MRNRPLSLLLLLLAVGCNNNSSVGAPCDEDDQCGDDLICDFHDGKGTCQAPHEHVSAGETHDESSGTDASSTANSTDDPTSTTTTSSTSATTGSTTHSHETHGHETTTEPGTTAASSTGSADEECSSYCACLETHCAQHGQFPHADAAACEAACAGFGAEERTCWTAYCELAADGGNAQDHYCEHASGALGLAECG